MREITTTEERKMTDKHLGVREATKLPWLFSIPFSHQTPTLTYCECVSISHTLIWNRLGNYLVALSDLKHSSTRDIIIAQTHWLAIVLASLPTIGHLEVVSSATTAYTMIIISPSYRQLSDRVRCGLVISLRSLT